MNESQFEDFLADCVEAVQARNDLLEQRHGLGHFARWDFDPIQPGNREAEILYLTRYEYPLLRLRFRPQRRDGASNDGGCRDPDTDSMEIHAADRIRA